MIGVRFHPVSGIFVFATASALALEPSQPPIQRVQTAFCPEVKQARRETESLHVSSAVIRMRGSVPPLSHTS
jgi:hypothetical protein